MNKTALITGASSGIGLEFAKLLAKEKYNLVLVSRDGAKLNLLKTQLEKEYQIEVKILPIDLSAENSSKEVYDQLKNEKIDIDLLINNAGFGALGNFDELNWELQRDMIKVNVISLVYLTKLFIEDMKERGYGGILNVASTAAFQPGPRMAIYYATKAFVLNFTLAIAHELKNSKIKIMALCPGPTKTDFQTRAGMTEINLMKFTKFHTAKFVAEYGYKAFLKGKTIAIPGTLNKIYLYLIRFIPRKLVSSIIWFLKK